MQVFIQNENKKFYFQNYETKESNLLLFSLLVEKKKLRFFLFKHLIA